MERQCLWCYSHYESSPGLTNVGQRAGRPPSADPLTKPTDLDVESACIGCYITYIHNRHYIITQPES